MKKTLIKSSIPLILIFLMLFMTACSSGVKNSDSLITKASFYDFNSPIPAMETDDKLTPENSLVIVKQLGVLYMNAALATTIVYGSSKDSLTYEAWKSELENALTLWRRLDKLATKI